VLAPSTRGAPGFSRYMVGDTVQPAADRLLLANRLRFSGKNEKRSLERVLGILFVVQHMATNIPNQPAVPVHEHFKSGVVALANKTLQQLGIAQVEIASVLRLEQSLELPENDIDLRAAHRRHPGNEDHLPL
jgi:hypothetical protein